MLWGLDMTPEELANVPGDAQNSTATASDGAVSRKRTPITTGDIMTAAASAGAVAGLTAVFGLELTGPAGGVVGVVEMVKRAAPKIPSTLVLIVVAGATGAALAGFDPSQSVVKATTLIGAAWLAYAGIVARFFPE